MANIQYGSNQQELAYFIIILLYNDVCTVNVGSHAIIFLNLVV